MGTFGLLDFNKINDLKTVFRLKTLFNLACWEKPDAEMFPSKSMLEIK